MYKNAIFIVVLGVLIAALVVVSNRSAGRDAIGDNQNVQILDGIQYVEVRANGGYSPRRTLARADVPTKLIVRTDGTYDCSAALVIRSIGYQKLLPPSGEETIDIGVPSPGTNLQGTCSMGMYAFTIEFQ